MMEKNRRLNEDVKQSVLRYFQKKKKFESATVQFEELKEQFNSDMEDYFSHEGITSEEFTFDELDDSVITVTRVQSSKVIFNIPKLKKALGKLSNFVIRKRYEITDMLGLITYLKECGIDPKIFKSFIEVSESVNDKELDRLFDIGQITKSQVAGCYTVKMNKPYFTVRARKGQVNDNGEEWSGR